MRRILPVACLLVSLGSGNLVAQSLQETLDDIDVGDRWKYNDWVAAQAAAVKSGKPILAAFR